MKNEHKGTEVKQLEIWNLDLETFPELGRVKLYEGTVNAGDWIYLPPATLHGVYNSESSWAVSQNSLYPPVRDRFIAVCSTLNALSCEQYMREVARNQTLGKCVAGQASKRTFVSKGQRKANLERCWNESPIGQAMQKEFDEEKSRDKPMSEVSGFKDFDTWCKATCRVFREFDAEGRKRYNEVRKRNS